MTEQQLTEQGAGEAGTLLVVSHRDGRYDDRYRETYCCEDTDYRVFRGDGALDEAGDYIADRIHAFPETEYRHVVMENWEQVVEEFDSGGPTAAGIESVFGAHEAELRVAVATKLVAAETAATEKRAAEAAAKVAADAAATEKAERAALARLKAKYEAVAAPAATASEGGV